MAYASQQLKPYEKDYLTHDLELAVVAFARKKKFRDITYMGYHVDLYWSSKFEVYRHSKGAQSETKTLIKIT